MRCRSVSASAFVVVLVGLGTAAIGTSPGGAAPRGTTDTSALVVESVSPWVAVDGVFSVAFEPTTEVPLDATLDVTIGQRLTTDDADSLRDATTTALAEGRTGGILQSTRRIPVLELGNPAEGLRLDVAVRGSTSSDDRAFIPTAGIHPVELVLTGPAGDPLWEGTVFLNRLPETTPLGRDGAPATTAVQLVAGLDTDPTLSAEGSFALPAEEQTAAGPSQSLLVEARDLPLTVALRPNSLVGLQRSDDPADRAFAELASESAWTLTRQSYVRVDAAGLAATGSNELQRQVLLGDGILTDLADTTGSPDTTGPGLAPIWMFDDSVDPAAATVLSDLGIRHLLTSDVRLALPEGLDESLARSRTFAVEGVEDLTVASYDIDLTRTMIEPDVDAGLRAHRTLTLAMGEWFDAIEEPADSFPGTSTAIVVPPAEIEVLEAIVAPLTESGPLQIAQPPPPAQSEEDSPLTARLRRAESVDLGAVVARTDAVGERIDGFRSMTTLDDPDAADWDLANDQTPGTFADEAAREALWNGIDLAIGDSLEMVEGPPSRTIVLTTRSGSIPLRFRNGLDSEVRLRMRTRSPRLEFPDGDTREIVLAPGENRIDVPVAVQAPGSSLLRIELTSPDGGLELREASVTVRSSSISGVGAALSVISLVVLGGWWIRTHRRRRTEQAITTGGDPQSTLRAGGHTQDEGGHTRDRGSDGQQDDR